MKRITSNRTPLIFGVMLATALSAAACGGADDGADGAKGDDGADGANGDDGADGANGDDGADGANGDDGADGDNGALVTTAAATAVDCPDGGVEIHVGMDEDDNGALEASEITATEIVCNGAPATAGTHTLSGTISGLGVGESVTMQVNGGDDLLLNANGSFEFATALGFGTVYEATVGLPSMSGKECTVMGATGTIIGSVGTVMVDCGQSWTWPAGFEDIFSARGWVNSDGFDVEMDDNGNAIVAWLQENATGDDSLYMAEYRSGMWTLPMSNVDTLDADATDGHAPYDVSVAMGNDGSVAIVWVEYDQTDGNGRIFLKEYRAGAWSMPTALSIAGGEASHPQVSMDDSGNTVVVWLQFDGSHEQAYRADYGITAAAAWTLPTNLADDHLSMNGAETSQPMVSVDGGQVVVGYLQDDGSTIQVYSVDYGLTAAATWTSPTIAADDHLSLGGANADELHVALDAGKAVYAWRQSDGANQQVYLADFNVTTDNAWTLPIVAADDHISADGEDASSIDLDMGSDVVVVTYNQNDQVFAYEYRNDAWGTTAKRLSPELSVKEWDAHVAVAAGGETVVSWTGYCGGCDNAITTVYLAEYRDGAWMLPIDNNDTISIFGSASDDSISRVAIDDNGNALTIWAENGPEVYYEYGYYNLYMGSYR